MKKSTELTVKKVLVHTCQGCGHTWEPRPYRRISDDREPRTCPKCKSPWWNVKRQGGEKK